MPLAQASSGINRLSAKVISNIERGFRAIPVTRRSTWSPKRPDSRGRPPTTPPFPLPLRPPERVSQWALRLVFEWGILQGRIRTASPLAFSILRFMPHYNIPSKAHSRCLDQVQWSESDEWTKQPGSKTRQTDDQPRPRDTARPRMRPTFKLRQTTDTTNRPLRSPARSHIEFWA